jgi:hypothetical protein
MRRHIRSILAAGALAALGALGGCPSAHTDYPGASCKTDSDCFKGEYCKDASICVPLMSAPDLAVTLPPGADMAGQPSSDMSGADL